MAVITPTEADVREMATNLVDFRGDLDPEEQRQFDAIAVMAFDVQSPSRPLGPIPGVDTVEPQIVDAPGSLERLDGAVDSLNDAMARLAAKMASFEEQITPMQAQMVEPLLVDACQEELSALVADMGSSVFGDDDDDVRGWMMITGARAWWRQPGAPDPAAMLAELGWSPSVSRDEAEVMVHEAALGGVLHQFRSARN